MASDCVRRDIASLESNVLCALVKDGLITLCKAYRVGTLDSNSTEKPRPFNKVSPDSWALF